MKNKSASFKFFNSPIPIIVVLFLFSVFLLIYIKYISGSTTLYTFSSVEGDYKFYNGTIYIGRDINYMGDTKMIFDGEDILLSDFEIGYYIKSNDDYIPISVVTKNDNIEGNGSLKKILEQTNFSFMEEHGDDAKFLSKENIKNIENLVFRINGKDKKNKDVSVEIPLEVSKLTN